jgi:hypothetical protein
MWDGRESAGRPDWVGVDLIMNITKLHEVCAKKTKKIVKEKAYPFSMIERREKTKLRATITVSLGRTEFGNKKIPKMLFFPKIVYL